MGLPAGGAGGRSQASCFARKTPPSAPAVARPAGGTGARAPFPAGRHVMDVGGSDFGDAPWYQWGMCSSSPHRACARSPVPISHGKWRTTIGPACDRRSTSGSQGSITERESTMPKEAPGWQAHTASGYDGAMTARCDGFWPRSSRIPATGRPFWPIRGIAPDCSPVSRQPLIPNMPALTGGRPARRSRM